MRSFFGSNRNLAVYESQRVLRLWLTFAEGDIGSAGRLAIPVYSRAFEPVFVWRSAKHLMLVDFVVLRSLLSRSNRRPNG